MPVISIILAFTASHVPPELCRPPNKEIPRFSLDGHSITIQLLALVFQISIDTAELIPAEKKTAPRWFCHRLTVLAAKLFRDYARRCWSHCIGQSKWHQKMVRVFRAGVSGDQKTPASPIFQKGISYVPGNGPNCKCVKYNGFMDSFLPPHKCLSEAPLPPDLLL